MRLPTLVELKAAANATEFVPIDGEPLIEAEHASGLSAGDQRTGFGPKHSFVPYSEAATIFEHGGSRRGLAFRVCLSAPR